MMNRDARRPQVIDEDALLCAACAAEAGVDCDEAQQVLNSPRVGVCGYNGPAIEIPKLVVPPI